MFLKRNLPTILKDNNEDTEFITEKELYMDFMNAYV